MGKRRPVNTRVAAFGCAQSAPWRVPEQVRPARRVLTADSRAFTSTNVQCPDQPLGRTYLFRDVEVRAVGVLQGVVFMVGQGPPENISINWSEKQQAAVFVFTVC